MLGSGASSGDGRPGALVLRVQDFLPLEQTHVGVGEGDSKSSLPLS